MRTVLTVATLLSVALGCKTVPDTRALAPVGKVPESVSAPRGRDQPVDPRIRLTEHTGQPRRAAAIRLLPEVSIPAAHPVDYESSAMAEEEELSQEGELPPPEEVSPETLELNEVVGSVVSAYPLLEAEIQKRAIAAGGRLEAAGAFDVKFKAESISKPLGFFENYRQQLGLERYTGIGGQVFAGYRLGRGDFEPWYQERPTNEGGEFKAGFMLPLLQNRPIDPRRAAVAIADLEMGRVEPEIQARLLAFVLEGSFAYWEWVAAGRSKEISQRLLDIALERRDALQRQVEEGDKAPINLTDNRRLIVSREAKLIAARQKLQQAAIKLSLFLRDSDGAPQIPSAGTLPASFPAAEAMPVEQRAADIDFALANRPELSDLALQQNQLQVELDLAQNQLLPEFNAQIVASDDVGEPTSPKKDKSPLVLEAGVFVEVPLQRRKALGKIRALEGKLSQLNAKRRFTADKIVAEVRNIYAALNAAQEQIQRARRSVELARELEAAERRAFELGASNLLNVNLREQQTADAAQLVVEAQLQYFQALSAYRAALNLPLPLQ